MLRSPHLLVFLAGLVTALATGLGALPFYLVDDVSDRTNVALWGVASGIMLVAAASGLLPEGLAAGRPRTVVAGLLGGAAFVVVADRLLDELDPDPQTYEAADRRRLVLIVGVLTVHSFPEGVAVGVAFAELSATGAGVPAVPPLAVAMTVAVSVHNVPEGVAVSIPLRAMDLPTSRTVWWSVFSSLPQPVGAVLAYAAVSAVRPLLPVGFGVAAGAMVVLVVVEFVPEALSTGRDLPGGGRRELLAGALAGGLGMELLLTAV